MGKFKEKRLINDIRMLSLDMINEAGSGHPGIALGAAPMLYTLFSKHLRFDLSNPNWFNRDRFVMSSGHGSALLYATLFCTMGEFSLNDLKNYREMYSQTPGHPEYNITKRIECTTGALGQGFATAVGMAIGGKHLSSFNTKKEHLFDYNVYVMCSDGDLMEGISYEAASLAGKLQLDNLIVLYDSNSVSLDGALEEEFSDDIADMYVSLGWDVIKVKNGESVKEINKALTVAKKNNNPTLIVVNTTIGKYSKYEGTNKIHSTLEKTDLEAIREKLEGNGPFTYDKVNLALYRQNIKERVSDLYSDWYVIYERFMANASDKVKEKVNTILANEEISLKLDRVIDTSKLFVDKSMLDINYQIMNVISAFVPGFIGGSADVVTSTKTYLKGKKDFSSDDYNGRNIGFGVREHVMGAIMNGLALVNLRSFGSAFLAFSDYMKPSIRMSSLMKLPVTYVFTHDSILIGSNGATHQPIEQLSMLRTIPNFTVYRPCDYKELLGSWNLILNQAKPCTLVLPKQHLDTMEHTFVDKVKYGAYVISEVKTRLDLIIIATGSEVSLAMAVKEELLKNYIEARVVSMPNMELFLSQDSEYQEEVLPKGYRRLVIEFSNDPNWYQFVNSKDDIIGINSFGCSGSSQDIIKEFEIDIPSIVIKIKNSL